MSGLCPMCEKEFEPYPYATACSPECELALKEFWEQQKLRDAASSSSTKET
jgi:hypothetical protein